MGEAGGQAQDASATWAMVDLDGTRKDALRSAEGGADFDHKGRWSYNVLLASLAGTGECLAVRNRPGNVRSSNGAAELLEETLPRVKGRFAKVLVRVDSDFDRRDVREACEAEGAFFAFVAREATNRLSWAEGIPESGWKPFRTRAHRERQARRARPGFLSAPQEAQSPSDGARGSGATRSSSSRGSGWPRFPGRPGLDEDLPDDPPAPAHRGVRGQEHLFDFYRYRYVVTNLPTSWSAEEVIVATYQRCDQENVIEQMGG